MAEYYRHRREEDHGIKKIDVRIIGLAHQVWAAVSQLSELIGAEISEPVLWVGFGKMLLPRSAVILSGDGLRGSLYSNYLVESINNFPQLLWLNCTEYFPDSLYR